MQKQTYTLSGLTCHACKKLTEKFIGKIPGVKNVDTNLETGIVTLDAERTINSNEINSILKGTPYEANN